MRRPFSVTILLWLVLSLTVWSGVRLYSAIHWWSTLAEFASPPGPLYIAATGGVWLIASMLLLWGVWQAKSWVRYALPGAGAALAVWNWSDRLLLQRPNVNWPFALAATFLLITVIIICVSVPGTLEFLSKREAHDR